MSFPPFLYEYLKNAMNNVYRCVVLNNILSEEDTRKRKNLSMYITAINMNPDFKAIRRSAYPIDNKIFILSTKMDL